MNKLINIKILLIIISLNNLNALLNAQTLTIGGKFGGNISNIYGNEVKNNSNNLGFCIGLLSNITIIDFLSIQGEVNFSQKGYKYYDTIVFYGVGEITIDYHYHYKYLNIPLLAKLTFGNNIKFYINAGTYIDILLSAKQKGEYISKCPKNYNIEYVNDEIKYNLTNKDYGITLGGGVFLPINYNNMNFIFDVRYDLGLATIERTGTVINPKSKNKNININLGVVYILD